MDILNSMLLESNRDPRFIGYAIMDNPVYYFSFSALYLVFVLKIGPEFMEKRKPYNVLTMVRVFNLFQVICNICAVVGMMYFGVYILGYSLLCQRPSFETDELTLKGMRLGYLYFLVRLSDYIDTVFFVLAKKQSHVTVLHVYHHICVTFNAWLFLRQGWVTLIMFPVTINAFIHVVMYTYFFLSTFPSLKKYLWWKKYLTGLQIIQFIAGIIQLLTVVASDDMCGYPMGVVFNCIANGVILLVLFVWFYIKNYTKLLATKEHTN